MKRMRWRRFLFILLLTIYTSKAVLFDSTLWTNNTQFSFNYTVRSTAGVIENSPPNRVVNLTFDLIDRYVVKQHAENAYVTLLHGVDDSLYYRGYLIGCLVIKQALKELNSTSDLVVMIGFKDDAVPSEHEVIWNDLDLLHRAGCILHFIPSVIPVVGAPERKSFLEYTLSKVYAWNLRQYRRLQFVDSDMLPLYNNDCLFTLPHSTVALNGAVSPINSGWMAFTPNEGDYVALKALAEWRTRVLWQMPRGWGVFPSTQIPLKTSKYKSITDWTFHGGRLEQGLFLHHFLSIRHDLVIIHDSLQPDFVQLYQQTEHGSRRDKQVPGRQYLSAHCDWHHRKHVIGWTHFVANKKPWRRQSEESLQKLANEYQLWFEYFDHLHLNINSSRLWDFFELQLLNKSLRFIDE